MGCRCQRYKLLPFGLQTHLLPLLPPQLPAPLKVHFLHDGGLKERHRREGGVSWGYTACQCVSPTSVRGANIARKCSWGRPEANVPQAASGLVTLAMDLCPQILVKIHKCGRKWKNAKTTQDVESASEEQRWLKIPPLGCVTGGVLRTTQEERSLLSPIDTTL